MSKIVLSDTSPTLVECGGLLYSLIKSEDGQLYIEAETCETLKVTVADSGEGLILAQGTWISVEIDNQEEE